MISFIVYIDHDHAKIFAMKPGQTEQLSLHKNVKLTHQKNQNDKKKDSSQLYHDVAHALKDASEVLVLGHGNAKDQFVHHLKEHKHTDVAKKIVGVETVDKPTDNQLLAFGRKFFKSVHAFTQ